MKALILRLFVVSVMFLGLPPGEVAASGADTIMALALATPLTVTLKANPPAYSGACPTTIKFTGSISGDPGSKLSYGFARIVGGTPSLTPMAAASIPATGVLEVTDAMVVTAAQAGVETETLRVLPGTSGATLKVIVGCVAPTPKPTATAPSLMNPGVSSVFAPRGTPTPGNPGVALGTAVARPTPTPIPNITLGGFLVRPIPAPRNFGNTTDPGVCSNHFPVPLLGPLACAAAIQSLLALIWDWTPNVCNGCPTDIDGYKIYRADGGQHTLVATQNQGTHVTVYGLDKPNDGTYYGKCYVATAYKGAIESLNSNKFCVGGLVNVGTKIVALFATSVLTTTQEIEVETGFGCTGGTVVQPISLIKTHMHVGYDYGSLGAGGEICYWHGSMWSRAGAYFDLSSLAGKKVLKATLHIPSNALTTTHGAKISNHQAPYHINDPADSSCITEIGTGTNYWWNNPMWLDMNTFDTRPFYGKLDFDVTAQVRPWTMGSANYGFVFRGEDEGQIVNDYQWHCNSYFYDKPTLTIEYFP